MGLPQPAHCGPARGFSSLPASGQLVPPAVSPSAGGTFLRRCTMWSWTEVMLIATAIVLFGIALMIGSLIP